MQFLFVIMENDKIYSRVILSQWQYTFGCNTSNMQHALETHSWRMNFRLHIMSKTKRTISPRLKLMDTIIRSRLENIVQFLKWNEVWNILYVNFSVLWSLIERISKALKTVYSRWNRWNSFSVSVTEIVLS